jgi:hypothetical protein
MRYAYRPGVERQTLTGAVMKPFGYYDLLEAFPQRGCALCRLLARDKQQYLELLIFEYTMDIEINAVFRAARGLCSAHGAEFMAIQMSAVSIAKLYGGVIEEALALVDGLIEAESNGRGRRRRDRAAGRAAADALKPNAPCPCCQSLNVREADYAQIAAESLNEQSFREAFAASEGFCLPHLERILRSADGEAARFLMTTQRRIWAQMRADLHMFVAKQDPRFGAPPTDAEARSWRRALESISGMAGIFGLRGR